jgi:hypothetical protein
MELPTATTNHSYLLKCGNSLHGRRSSLVYGIALALGDIARLVRYPQRGAERFACAF